MREIAEEENRHCDIPIVAMTKLSEVPVIEWLFQTIAAEEGWYPGDALHAHRDRSAYFAARVGDLLAGGLQLVLPRPGCPLPCQSVWPEIETADTWNAAEVLILALLPKYRGRHGLLWPLCVAMWHFCVDTDIETLLLEATPATLAVYRRLGFPLEVVGDLREHWGEDCYLCRMGVREVADALAAKAERSRTYQEVLALADRNAEGTSLAPPPAS